LFGASISARLDVSVHSSIGTSSATFDASSQISTNELNLPLNFSPGVVEFNQGDNCCCQSY
jgi:hypothetical protein